MPNPYAPPQSLVADVTSPCQGTRQPPRRGPLLSTFLVVALLACFAGWMLYFKYWHRMTTQYPSAALYLLALISVLRPIAIAAIWRMSRGGVILYTGLSAAGLLVGAYVGVMQSWLGVVGVVLLWLLVFRKWSGMQWGLSPAGRAGRMEEAQ